MRWRPLGNSYLWSEVHDLSNILSQEIKIGFLRSFVCYPSHPSSDPFRCCISVQKFGIPSSESIKGSSSYVNNTTDQSVQSCTHGWMQSKKQCIHQVTLSTPLVVYSYLPDAVSLTIESGGVTRTALLSEVGLLILHISKIIKFKCSVKFKYLIICYGLQRKPEGNLRLNNWNLCLFQYSLIPSAP